MVDSEYKVSEEGKCNDGNREEDVEVEEAKGSVFYSIPVYYTPRASFLSSPSATSHTHLYPRRTSAT